MSAHTNWLQWPPEFFGWTTAKPARGSQCCYSGVMWISRTPQRGNGWICMAWILCLASHTLPLEPEKMVAPDTVLCLCPCTALCQRSWVAPGANTQSAGFGAGAAWGGVIFNPDHNNGLTHIMAPQVIGMKGNSCAVSSCTRMRMRGWGKAVSSAPRDSFPASTLCNFTLTACSSQPSISF